MIDGSVLETFGGRLRWAPRVFGAEGDLTSCRAFALETKINYQTLSRWEGRETPPKKGRGEFVESFVHVEGIRRRGLDAEQVALYVWEGGAEPLPDELERSVSDSLRAQPEVRDPEPAPAMGAINKMPPPMPSAASAAGERIPRGELVSLRGVLRTIGEAVSRGLNPVGNPAIALAEIAGMTDIAARLLLPRQDSNLKAGRIKSFKLLEKGLWTKKTAS